MSDERELLAAVRARTEGTPYVVTETDDGFDMRIDIADASWHGLLHAQHLDKAWTYHVRLAPEKRLTITDDVRTVTWRAGAGPGTQGPVPVLSASAGRRVGRWNEKGFQKTWAVDERGSHGTVVDFTVDSAWGRDLIRGPARELGWAEERGGAERTGLYVAVGTIALLVLAGLVVAVVALAGGL